MKLGDLQHVYDTVVSINPHGYKGRRTVSEDFILNITASVF
jgi:hypothetical protein